jgi:hypothetical protein
MWLVSQVSRIGQTVHSFGQELQEMLKEPDQLKETAKLKIPAAAMPKVLDISSSISNFSAPPPTTDYKFDMNLHVELAKELLQIDEKLARIRFEMVPKVMQDSDFWKNYFYRVFLIIQEHNLQLTSLPNDTLITNLNKELGNEQPKNLSESLHNEPENSKERLMNEPENVREALSKEPENENFMLGNEPENAEMADDIEFGSDWEREMEKELNEQ